MSKNGVLKHEEKRIEDENEYENNIITDGVLPLFSSFEIRIAPELMTEELTGGGQIINGIGSQEGRGVGPGNFLFRPDDYVGAGKAAPV